MEEKFKSIVSRKLFRVFGNNQEKQAVGVVHHHRNQAEDSMNLFVTLAIISFLFLQASCGALLSCESDMRGTQNTMVDLCIKSVGIIGIESKLDGGTGC